MRGRPPTSPHIVVMCLVGALASGAVLVARQSPLSPRLEGEAPTTHRTTLRLVDDDLEQERGVAILQVDTDRRLGTIDQKIYGQFLEHINHSVEMACSPSRSAAPASRDATSKRTGRRLDRRTRCA